jgi:hypothetical protein
LAVLIAVPLPAQQNSAPEPRWFVGSSAFVLANALLPEPPHFYQLNLGYRLSSRDAVSLEAITWRYSAPLGIPYGPSYESPDEEYPGDVRARGIGVAYQRTVWRNAYTALHAAAMRQRFHDEHGAWMQNGFQLFVTARAGYQFRLLRDRMFVEPSLAITHWPITTNVPDSFAAKDRRWPTYFLGEPGLHFGVRF